jgi:hypothetical protein
VAVVENGIRLGCSNFTLFEIASCSDRDTQSGFATADQSSAFNGFRSPAYLCTGEHYARRRIGAALGSAALE